MTNPSGSWIIRVGVMIMMKVYTKWFTGHNRLYQVGMEVVIALVNNSLFIDHLDYVISSCFSQGNSSFQVVHE